MSGLTWIGVALIGGVAAVARVSVDAFSATYLTRRLGGLGPRLVAGIFVVNLTGSFLLGLVDGLAVSGDASILIATAAIGTYTTFSTWMLQSRSLARDGARRAAVLNIVLSLLAGFAAVALGRLIGTGL